MDQRRFHAVPCRRKCRTHPRKPASDDDEGILLDSGFFPLHTISKIPFSSRAHARRPHAFIIALLEGDVKSRAQELLTQGDLPIGEIAEKCGFENVYYFSAAFKKRVGLPPSEYRKRLQL